MRARKRKKKRVDAGPPGAPEWVVTFTDMISLLVTFFVLLMTFSSLEEYDLLKVESWLAGQKGVLESKGFVMPELPDVDQISASDMLRGARNPHSRPPSELPDNIEEMGQRESAEHLALDLERAADGLVIEFGPEASFAPGSAEPPAELARSLGEIGRVLEHYPHMVVVEGFADAGFRPTPHFRDADAVAFARAEAAARILLSESGLRPEQVQLASKGDRSPRAEDATAEGRLLDRRVQLRVLSLSRLRAVHLEARRFGGEAAR
jgi:chemotaxis protein MotB